VNFIIEYIDETIKEEPVLEPKTYQTGTKSKVGYWWRYYWQL
jgi:hypothetical protein